MPLPEPHVNLEQLEAEMTSGFGHVQTVILTRSHWALVVCSLQGAAGACPSTSNRGWLLEAAREIQAANHFEPTTERFLQQRWEGLR